MLLITHDLGIVSRMADDVAVMYAGEVVESGPVEQIVRDPQHHQADPFALAKAVRMGATGRCSNAMAATKTGSVRLAT